MGFDLTGLGSAFDFAGKVIDKIFPDPAQRDAAKLAMLKAQQDGEFKEMDQAFEVVKAQLAINQSESGNASVFVSGWRPGIGWVCCFALAYQYLFKPIGSWAAAAAGHPLPPMPGLDDNLWQLMLGMLGLGGLRTYEKARGVAAK